MEGKQIDLNSLDMDELTGVINLYPWFGAARMELCRRMSETVGGGWGINEYSDAAMYVQSRAMVSDIIRASRKIDYSDKDVENLLKSCIAPDVVRKPARTAGGDFFSQEEYEDVKRSEDNVFSKFVAERSDEAGDKRWEDPELGFCTETLASIYAEQGYFAEAKKIYSRLVLRYPEKSAYFASLVEKMEEEK